MPIPGTNELHSSTTVSAFGLSLKSGHAQSATQMQRAGKEFESMLLTQWLQDAETSFATVPGAENEQDAGDEQMKSFGVQALAKAFSDSGGLGIADLVTKALRQNGDADAQNTSQPAGAVSDARAITYGKV